jgi:hypothetical protein
MRPCDITSMRKLKSVWNDRDLCQHNVKTDNGSWDAGPTGSTVQFSFYTHGVSLSLMIPGRLFKKMCEWITDPIHEDRFDLKDWGLLENKGEHGTVQFYYNFVLGQSGSWWWVPTGVFKELAEWYLADQERKAA